MSSPSAQLFHWVQSCVQRWVSMGAILVWQRCSQCPFLLSARFFLRVVVLVCKELVMGNQANTVFPPTKRKLTWNCLSFVSGVKFRSLSRDEERMSRRDSGYTQCSRVCLLLHLVPSLLEVEFACLSCHKILIGSTDFYHTPQLWQLALAVKLTPKRRASRHTCERLSS